MFVPQKLVHQDGQQIYQRATLKRTMSNNFFISIFLSRQIKGHIKTSTACAHTHTHTHTQCMLHINPVPACCYIMYLCFSCLSGEVQMKNRKSEPLSKTTACISMAVFIYLNSVIRALFCPFLCFIPSIKSKCIILQNC